MPRNQFVVAVVLAAAVVACGFGATPSEAPSDAFWAALSPGPDADEVDRFDSLKEMAAGSDAVVLGSISSIVVGRLVGGDASGDVIAYVQVAYDVEKVVAGDAPDHVTIEFLGGSPDAARALVGRALAAGLPHTMVLIFLHAKLGAGEAGLYRPVNSTGVWAATRRAALDSPLQQSAPSVSGLYEREIVNLRNIDDLAALVSSFEPKAP